MIGWIKDIETISLRVVQRPAPNTGDHKEYTTKKSNVTVIWLVLLRIREVKALSY